jgi:ribosome maturation factor RimP
MTEMTESPIHQRFIQENGAAARVAQLAEPVIEDLGFRLVRVKMVGGNTLQIMADKQGGTISIDDCALISRRLSPLLDVHDPISSGYFLEVSTPGIDRPLVRPSDIVDWIGHEAKIELREMIDGRRRFRGVLEGFEDGELRLVMALEGYDEPQIIGLPVALISEAKLVLTERLLKMAQSANTTVEANLVENDDNLE